jgi:iron complex transport system substrate-binding protein
LTRRRWLARAAATLAALSVSCERGQDHGAAADAAPSSSSEARVAADARIVSVGGSVTEIVFALGWGSRVVAVDTSSLYPSAVRALPQVGYQRTLAAEGIAAQRPTVLLLSADAGPPTTIEQLRGLGIRIDIVPTGDSLDAAKEKIRRIAAVLGEKGKGEELVGELSADMADAEALVRRASSKPRVLFVHARSGGAMMVGGRATSAAEMIRLAAGENAVTAFEGFKPLTAEAVTTAAPDVILIPEHSFTILGGVDSLVAQPGVALTPAGKARRVIAMDDLLLLGFGPRLGRSVRELAILLHPELGKVAP